MNSTMLRVTNRIIERSRDTRAAYLARINQPNRHRASCATGLRQSGSRIRGLPG